MKIFFIAANISYLLSNILQVVEFSFFDKNF